MSPAVAGDGAPKAKQVVFVFMAATVAAVVVFLCGVLVGRGVPPPVSVGADPAIGMGPKDLTPATLGVPRSEPSAGAAVSEGLDYHRILTGESRVPGADPSVDPLAPAGLQLPPDLKHVAPPRAESPGGGYYVQVVSLSEAGAGQIIVDRLIAKGLPALLLPPADGALMALYRVRVGPYAQRAEAERVSERIETEDGFTPLVVR